jgi:hypothetical protein
MAKKKKGVNKPAPEQATKKALVQCRIEACQTIDELVAFHKDDEKPLSVRAAMMQIAEDEGGVPYNTLKRWYYKDDESKVGSKLTQPQAAEKAAKTKARVASKIVKNINKALDKEEEDAQAYWQRKAAGELAEELGGAVLAEEMYELFLKIVKEMDEFVRANKEIGFPVSINWIKQQLARMARNSAVAEENIEGVTSGELAKDVEFIRYCSNRTCENFVSKSDRKKARAAIKQKAKWNK